MKEPTTEIEARLWYSKSDSRPEAIHATAAVSRPTTGTSTGIRSMTRTLRGSMMRER